MVECESGKVCHRSERAARGAAIGVGFRRTHTRLRVYLCARCHFWHLTSRPGQSRLERRRHRLSVRVPTPATAQEVAAFFAKYGAGRTMVT